MNSREFAASVIQSLAWPAALALIVWLLREQAKSLLQSLIEGRLKSVKAGPVSLEFYEGLANARAELGFEAEAGEGSDQDGSTPREVFVGDIRPVADTLPSAAVVEGFSRVEAALNQRIAGVADLGSRPMSVMSLTKLAVDRDILAPRVADVVLELRHLRNLAAHGQGSTITATEANQYLDLVEDVLGEVVTWIKPDDPDAPGV